MVTSMKKMTETIYYMVTSSKNKEDNIIYMMSSVTEAIFTTKIEMAVTVSTEMTVVTMTMSTEEILETVSEMVVASEEKSIRCRN
jgi:hypothetical protein